MEIPDPIHSLALFSCPDIYSSFLLAMHTSLTQWPFQNMGIAYFFAAAVISGTMSFISFETSLPLFFSLRDIWWKMRNDVLATRRPGRKVNANFFPLFQIAQLSQSPKKIWEIFRRRERVCVREREREEGRGRKTMGF